RVQDCDVIQAGCARGRGRAAFRLPRVEAEVVVVAPRGQEQCISHAKDHVKAQDLDIEVMNAVDVRRLEVDVADSRPRGYGARSTLPGSDAVRDLMRDLGLHAHYFSPQSGHPIAGSPHELPALLPRPSVADLKR